MAPVEQGRRRNRSPVSMAEEATATQTEEEMRKAGLAASLCLAGAGTTAGKWSERVGNNRFVV